MSQNQEDEDKKKASQQKPAENAEKPAQQESAPAKSVSRPAIGTPIGRPVIGKPIDSSTQSPPATPAPAPSQQAPRPTIGKPAVGTPSPAPSAAAPSASVGQPVAAPRPTIGRPVVGTSTASAAKPSTASGPAVAVKPTVPSKPEVPKSEISRRNFIRAIAVIGGVVAAVQFGIMGPYLEGTVGSNVQPAQAIEDAKTNLPIKTTDIPKNNWTTFVWPRTGNPNIDADTFSQWVVVHLPSGLTAPPELSAKDPLTGDIFIALSRVCVHLWCLWSYVPADQRGECPCHGSQYVPGMGPPYNEAPGTAVLGPASLQTPPNNMLPILPLSIAADGTISAKPPLVGQIGCGQKC